MNRPADLHRPFSTWSVEPFPDEPAHGYFARLVAEEGHRSVKVYTSEIGIEGKATKPALLLQRLLTLPIPEAWAARLRRATPIQEGDWIVMGDERLRRMQWSVTKRRYCPACLAEASYHRSWWDILPILTCPYHGLPLKDCDDDGNAVRWWWPHMDATPKGNDLAIAGHRVAEVPQGFGGYVIGRLGFAPHIPAPLLDERPLSDVMDMCARFGQLLDDPSGRSRPVVTADSYERGFEALSAGPGHLVETIRKWMRSNSTETQRRRGYSRLWEWGVIDLCSRDSGLMEVAVKKALAAENRRSDRSVTDEDFRIPDVGMEELRLRLGIGKKAMVTVTESLGILPERDWMRAHVHFNAEEVELVEEFFEDLITRVEAAEMLGILSTDVSKLVDKGWLAAYKGVSRGGRTGRRFRRSEVAELLCRIPPPTEDFDARLTVSFTTLAKRYKKNGGLLAVRVLEGKEVPVSKDESKPGFAGLRFKATSRCVRSGREKSARLRQRTAKGSRKVSAAKAAALLGVSPPTVVALVKKRMLRGASRRGKSGLHKIPAKAVHDFASAFANVQVYRDYLGLSYHEVMSLLADKGVEPVVTGSDIPHASTVVNRKEAREALRLPCDPDQMSGPEAVRFWNAIHGEVDRLGLRYQLPGKLLSQVSATTSSRELVLRFRLVDDQTKLEMTARFDPRTGPRRWKTFRANEDMLRRSLPGIEWIPDAEGCVIRLAKPLSGSVAPFVEAMTVLESVFG